MHHYHVTSTTSAVGMQAMKFEPSPKDLAILLANRSFCLLRLGRGKDALSDADACTMVRPRWPKGYYRKGAALMLQEVTKIRNIIVTPNLS